jgi:hypothetical protein
MRDRTMLHITYLAKGLFGFAAISSFAGFVFHAVSGNSDMALICFVGVGGSAAMAWMFAMLRRA